MLKIIFIFIIASFCSFNFVTVHSKLQLIGKFDTTLKARLDGKISTVEGNNVDDAGLKAPSGSGEGYERAFFDVRERVVRYRCFQERASWRIWLIPHVGVLVHTDHQREYFVEKNDEKGTLVNIPRSNVNYAQWFATWNWEEPTGNHTLGQILEKATPGYSVFSNDCYNAREEVLGMLRPEKSCDRLRCIACGWE